MFALHQIALELSNNIFLFSFFGTDDEDGNVKPMLLNGSKSKTSQDELQVRLGFFLENNHARNRTRGGQQSCNSLNSTNTSPVSTLTGSSEGGSNLQDQVKQNGGCDSIGSLMSVSISGSNASSSPAGSRRHSVTSKNISS